MTNNSTLEHPGIISKIENDTIFVDIHVASACSSCHAQGYCSAFGKNDKIIEVSYIDFPEFQKGDSVNVIVKESLGMQALLLGYILPVIVLLITLFTVYGITQHEGLSAIVTLIAVALYYISLFFFRNRIKKHFTFRLKKI